MFGGCATTGTDPARRKDPGALHGRRWWIGCSFWWLGRIIYQQKHWLIIIYYNIYYHHLVKSTWVSESYWCGHKWVSILYTDILDVDHLKMAHGGLLKCAGPKSSKLIGYSFYILLLCITFLWNAFPVLQLNKHKLGVNHDNSIRPSKDCVLRITNIQRDYPK